MFTGLTETTGAIKSLRQRGDYLVIAIDSDLSEQPLTLGESVACDGVCLTVVSSTSSSFTVEASAETTNHSVLRSYKTGTVVNLERALKVGDRLGGHFVSGHVDVVGKVDYLKTVGESLELAIEFDKRHDKLVVEKGSIAIDGLSLTVNKTRPGWFCVNIIPHTARVTTINSLTKRSKVNLEFDLIGKYVLKMHDPDTSETLTKNKLIESGW